LTDPIRINLIIAVHGPCPKLARTLDSLAAAARPKGFEQLWIVENGDKGPAESVCRRFTQRLPITYRHTPVQGKSRALQATLEAIPEGLIVFTDDDVRVATDWLEHYETAASTHGPDAFYGGPLHVDYERPPPDWLRPHLPPSATGWSLSDPARTITQACFLGANYGVFIESIQSVGGFNFMLGVGAGGNPIGEEFDLQDRLLAAGKRAVYLPDAAVWHWVPRERCTPQWALNRTHRIWLTNGLEDTLKLRRGPSLRGAPRWLWRRVAGLGLRAAIARLIPGARLRFARQLPYQQWKGYLQGMRLAARSPATAAGDADHTQPPQAPPSTQPPQQGEEA